VHEHGESTDRQYQLTGRASELGWSHSQIEVIDQDLGVSGGASTHREGFAPYRANLHVIPSLIVIRRVVGRSKNAASFTYPQRTGARELLLPVDCH
jgi:hypothetical protein